MFFTSLGAMAAASFECKCAVWQQYKEQSCFISNEHVTSIISVQQLWQFVMQPVVSQLFRYGVDFPTQNVKDKMIHPTITAVKVVVTKFTGNTVPNTEAPNECDCFNRRKRATSKSSYVDLCIFLLTFLHPSHAAKQSYVMNLLIRNFCLMQTKS